MRTSLRLRSDASGRGCGLALRFSQEEAQSCPVRAALKLMPDASGRACGLALHFSVAQAPVHDTRWRNIAMEVAHERLPEELKRLPALDVLSLRELCGVRDCNTNLVSALGQEFLPCLFTPPGDAVSKLEQHLPEEDARMMMELFWRCVPAVALMPAAALESLAHHHHDLHLYLSVIEPDEKAQRRRLVSAVLPRFSMVCQTQDEIEAGERLRREAAERRRKNAAERDEGCIDLVEKMGSAFATTSVRVMREEPPEEQEVEVEGGVLL